MSNTPYKRILVITDGLKSSDAIHESALNIAREHGAKVTLANTVREPGRMSKWLSPNSTDVFEMVVADKQKRLDACANQFIAAGIEATAKVLIGKSSEAIAKEAITSEADLVIRYRKGALSKFSGSFGSTARTLMRFCPVPVLFVGDEPFSKPTVLACVDVEHEASENQSILDEAALLGQEQDRLHCLYCWDFFNADMLERELAPNSYNETLDFAKSVHEESFSRFRNKYDLSNFSKPRIEKGFTHAVIRRVCEEEGIDVVVMCSATLNHPLRRYFGSTIESVIENIPCSLLVVKPEGFVSPMLKSLADATTA